MSKLAKNYYYNSKGEKKLNCYLLNIPKDIVQKSNIKDDDIIKVYEDKGKIIIEKEK